MAPGFRIEDNILKGDDVPYQCEYSSLGEFILHRLKARPDLIGQIDTTTGEEYTYEKMLDRSLRCARWMKLQGLAAGDVITICSHNQLDVAMPCFAAMYLGVAVSPLDFAMSRKELTHLLSITEPKVLFVSKDVANVIAAAATDAKLEPKIIVFGQMNSFLDFESAITLQSGTTEVANFECTPIERPNTIAFIMCTSGTTGSPKGVALGHEAFLRQLSWSKTLVELVNMCAVFTSISWITGIMNLLMSLSVGIPRLIVPPFEEYSACELIEKYKVNWIFMPPNMINRLLTSGAMKNYDMSCLKEIACGGSLLSLATREALAKILPDVQVVTFYGSTEICGVFSRQTPTSKPGPCGRIAENCHLKVIDPDTGKILGPNQQGELLLKNTIMMNGYYRNPQATAEAVDAEGWMHSGDLGYYDEDGEIFIIDRLKELIKYRGYHISPSDIESLILSHRGVADVAVVGLPHPVDDEHPVAIVVRTADSVTANKGVTGEEIFELVASEMSESKRLRGGVLFVERIPRTATGKLQRRVIRNLAISMITA